MIGTGMWLALVMACNVWLIICPNQKTIPGIVGRTAGQKAAAANPRSTRAASTPLSIAVLYCMVAQQNAPI